MVVMLVWGAWPLLMVLLAWLLPCLARSITLLSVFLLAGDFFGGDMAENVKKCRNLTVLYDPSAKKRCIITGPPSCCTTGSWRYFVYVKQIFYRHPIITKIHIESQNIRQIQYFDVLHSPFHFYFHNVLVFRKKTKFLFRTTLNTMFRGREHNATTNVGVCLKTAGRQTNMIGRLKLSISYRMSKIFSCITTGPASQLGPLPY